MFVWHSKTDQDYPVDQPQLRKSQATPNHTNPSKKNLRNNMSSFNPFSFGQEPKNNLEIATATSAITAVI